MPEVGLRPASAMKTERAPTRIAELPDPWARHGDLYAAVPECRASVERLVKKLGVHLNRVHGVNLPERYWRILLGSWVLYHVQQLTDRYERCRAALSAGVSPVALDPVDFRAPLDTEEYSRNFFSPHYGDQLLSLCWRHLGAGQAIRSTPPKRVTPTRPALPRRVFHSLRRLAYAAGRNLLRPTIITDGVYPLNRQHELLSWRLRGEALPFLDRFPDGLCSEADVTDPRRKALSAISADGDFEKLLVSSLSACLPAQFLEGWAEARNYAQSRLPRSARVFVHSTGLYFQELYKFVVAEASLGGARLVGVQHGGHYGTSLWMNTEWLERWVNDRYLTWGWTEDEKTVGIPVPWLSRPLERASETAGVILICTTGTHFPHELSPAPMAEQWHRTFRDRDRFLEALGEIRAQTTVRLVPRDYGWNERAQISNRFPDVRFDQPGNRLESSLKSAALAVTEYPGTAFLECLAYDVPSVHFWNDQDWPSRPAAAQALGRLRDAGIVHHDAASAARQVSAVIKNPAAWWNQPEVRAARADFATTFARSDKDWAATWAAQLTKECSNAK